MEGMIERFGDVIVTLVLTSLAIMIFSGLLTNILG